MLRSTVGTYLRIEGSAGWPAGQGLDESQVNALAFERARAVQDYIIKFGDSRRAPRAGHLAAPLPGVHRPDARRDDRAGVSLVTP